MALWKYFPEWRLVMGGCEEEYENDTYRMSFLQPRCYVRADGGFTKPLMKVWLMQSKNLLLEIEVDFQDFRTNREIVMQNIRNQVATAIAPKIKNTPD